jgi:hypothetical protein
LRQSRDEEVMRVPEHGETRAMVLAMQVVLVVDRRRPDQVFAVR